MLTSSQSCMARGVKTVNLIDCQGVLDSSCSKRGTKKRAKWEKNACHGLVFICRHKQQGERQIMSGRHLMGTKALLRCWVLFTDTLQTDTLDSTILNNNKKIESRSGGACQYSISKYERMSEAVFLHMHDALHDAFAVSQALWVIYCWNYWEAVER